MPTVERGPAEVPATRPPVRRALILYGTLLGRPPHTPAPLLRLGNGESVFGRQVRLLAARGITEIAMLTADGEPGIQAEADRPEFDRIRFHHLTHPWGDQPILREFLEGCEQLLVLADDLIFGGELIDWVMNSPQPQVAACQEEVAGGPQLEVHSASGIGASGQVSFGGAAGPRALARDGILSKVGTDLAGGGSRGFWPLLRLSRAAVEAWLVRADGSRPDADRVLAGLNRVAGEQEITLLPAAGRYVARVGQADTFDDLAEQVRLADLRTQSVIDEPRGYVGLGAELARRGIDRLLVVGDHTYEGREVARYIDGLNLETVRFREFSAVPTWEQVLSALRLFQAGGCQAILSVGDAAAISVGKLVRLFARAEPSAELIDRQPGFSMTAHLTVPTAGSLGSESSLDAVLRVAGRLRRIQHDSLLPDLVFLDPLLWAQEPEPRRCAAVLGALSLAVSSVWTATADGAARKDALSSLALILDGLFDFVKGDVPAAQRAMMTAANLAGRAATLTGPSVLDTVSHALAEDLDIDFGEAAAFCLPELWRRLAKQLAASDLASATDFRHACDLLSAQLDAGSISQAITRTERIVELLRDPTGHAVEPGTSAPSNPDLSLPSPLPLSPADVRAIHAEAADWAARPRPERFDFDVLAQFGEFCRARRLTYHLFGQTLLDAVTIRRLSPWSGPITVALPSASYRNLVRWRDQLPPDLWLDDAPGNGGDRSPRVVRSSGLRPTDPDALPGITLRILEGVNDGSSPSQLLRRSALELAHDARLAARQQDARPPAGPKRAANRAAARLGAERLARLRSRLIAKGRRRPGVYTYLDTGSTAEFSRSRYPAAWFGKGGEQFLGGLPFHAPLDPEAVLERFFGADLRGARAIPTGPVPSVPLTMPAAKAELRPSSPEPFVSVIVPVYDVERYLPACLDSLCLQDTDGYEIIAVDDGSPDGSLDILREYEQRFPEILRVVRKPNGGLSDARNYGLRFARGEYVGFVDSDDLVMPSMIRLMRHKAAVTGADVVVCNHAEYWGESDRAELRWMSFINSYGHSVSERPELLVAVHPYAWNKLYRRRLFDDFEISYPVGQAFEDSATTFNLLLHANKIEYVDEALYFYRMDRVGSITNTFNRKFYDIFKSFDSIRGFYTRHGRYAEFHEEIGELMRRTAFARVTALETCRDPGQVQDFLNAIYDYLDEHAPDWAENKYFRRQMANPKYAKELKYRSMHSRQLMLKYFEQLWQNRGDDLAAAQGYSTGELIGMLQQEELQILLQIDRFCAERGLTYYLAEGSLLGAIRHQGFIPWDDDVDIVMPRADYERFLDALVRNEEPSLRLFNERTYPRYHLTFSKVLSSRPSGFTNSRIAVPPEFQGPCVDVFPLDAAPRRRDLATERRVRRLRDMLLFKVGFLSEKAKRKRYRTYRASRVVPFGYLQRTIQRLYRRHQNDPSATWLANFASSYPVDREKVKAACYGEPVRVPFEGHLLPVPADWDAVLSTTYGHYMGLPPVDQRVPRHRPRWRALEDG